MILLLATLAGAAEPLALTYDDALRRASEANPTVLGARLDYLAAEGALLAARAPFGATFSATGGYGAGKSEDPGLLGTSTYEYKGWNASGTLSQAFASGTAVGVTLSEQFSDTYYKTVSELGTFESDEPGLHRPALEVSLSQSLLQGFRLAYNLQGVRAARTARSAAEARRQGARQTALADTAKAYWALYYATRSVEIATGAEETQREQARVVAALVDAGKLAPIEGTRSAAAIAQAERTRLDAENAAAAARDALLGLVGEQPGMPVALLTTPGTPPAITLDEQAVVTAVRQGNPDLLAMRLQAGGASDAARDAKHGLLPQLDAVGTWRVGGSDEGAGAAWAELGSGALTNWTIGANLEVPLANRADRGALAQRQAEAERANVDLLTLEIALAQQALTEVRAITTARRSVELAELNLSLAEETLRVEQARLQEGKTLQKDVIAAVNDLASARLAREKAVIDFQNAVVELERLKGSL